VSARKFDAIDGFMTGKIGEQAYLAAIRHHDALRESAARTDVPALADAVLTLAAELEQARARIAELECDSDECAAGIYL
jgi:hypothetical protein